MAVHRIEELPWAKLRKLAQGNALFLLPLGPIEDHGSHLPAGTDWFLTEGFTKDISERIVSQRPDQAVVHAPVMAVGSSVLQNLGCLRLKPGTLTRALTELIGYLEREGVRHVALLSAHGAVSQGMALNAVCRHFNRRGKLRCAAPTLTLIARFLAGAFRAPIEAHIGRAFTDAEWKELRHDIHGGAWETALMLQYRPDLVQDYYRGLPPHVPDRYDLKALRKLSTHRGYFGSPARATPELGAALREVLADQGTRVLLDFLDDKKAGPKPVPTALMAGSLAAAAVLAWFWLTPRPRSEAR